MKFKPRKKREYESDYFKKLREEFDKIKEEIEEKEIEVPLCHFIGNGWILIQLGDEKEVIRFRDAPYYLQVSAKNNRLKYNGMEPGKPIDTFITYGNSKHVRRK